MELIKAVRVQPKDKILTTLMGESPFVVKEIKKTWDPNRVVIVDSTGVLHIFFKDRCVLLLRRSRPRKRNR